MTARVTNSFTLCGVRKMVPLEKRPIKSGDQTIEFVVDRKPALVGVDPYLKPISRNTSNSVKSLGAKAGS